jgi:hypothetical protein
MKPSEELITLMADLEIYLNDLDLQIADVQEKRLAAVKSLETLKNLMLEDTEI